MGSVSNAADLTKVKSSAYNAIDQAISGLQKLNKNIHDNPELAYNEVLAHQNITSFLEEQGFQVKRHTYGLETSFEAEIGSGDQVIIYCAEYDALPKIGHACGHNLIAISSIAAFIGAAKAAVEHGIVGRIRLLGTPAEEGAGGKVKLIEAGAFDGNVAAAIMAHPLSLWTFNGQYDGLAGLRMAASHKLRVEFRGKNAHAGFAPWQGVNALDAAVQAYNNVAMLRHQIRPDERIHGVFEDGGTVPNVIPDYTRMNWYVRAPTVSRCEALYERVKNCFAAAALATGCSVEYIPALHYSDLRANDALCKVYVDDMAELGSKVQLHATEVATASTDMGNVSYKCPSFHSGFGIEAPVGIGPHHPDFAATAGTAAAFDQAIKVSKAMAMMGARILTDPDLARQAREDFEKSTES